MNSADKRLGFELTMAEGQRVMAIVMDEDETEALKFLKECLDRRIRDRLRPHCVPVFEVSYNPRQGDSFDRSD